MLKPRADWAGLRVGLEVLVGPTTDPPTNLALEDEILREVEASVRPDTLRLWVDEQCLVRGPHRSKLCGWHEVSRAAHLGVPIYQRSTGGGTVYHDPGNLNWSFHLRRAEGYVGASKLFRAAAGFIVDSLQPLGISASFGAPNRIDVGGKKISGLASRASLGAALVHGTLLVSADLDRLNALCIPPPGCPPVTRLVDLIPGLSVAEVIGAIVSHAGVPSAAAAVTLGS